jgi:maltose O-acetyltransferase
MRYINLIFFRVHKKLINFFNVDQRKKLIKRGLKIGKNFKMLPGCIIDPDHCWLIEIGDNVTLAPNVHILAHDTSTKEFLGYTKISSVTIRDRVFIGAGTIVLPGVVIENNVIVAAGSVVSKRLEKNSVYGGVPAKRLCSLDDYLDKTRKNFNKDNLFNEKFTLRKNINQNDKILMRQVLKKYKAGFVE